MDNGLSGHRSADDADDCQDDACGGEDQPDAQGERETP
jgi:hypothetical protein